MKKVILGLVLPVLVLVGCKGSGGGSSDIELLDENDSMSYALACLIADNNTRNFGNDVDIEAFVAGFRDQNDSSVDALISLEEAEMVYRHMLLKSRTQ
jgi:hypothetical protein